MAVGMSRETGKPVSDEEHLRQSIRDILTTRIGTRVMLRDYGSNIPEMVDRPINKATIAAIRSDMINALNKWEPRARIDQITIKEISSNGSIMFDVFLTYLPNGEAYALRGINI